MKAIVVYGCPCSGKSTYVRENAAANDIIYDFDSLLRAVTTITTHIPDECATRWPVFKLRRALVNASKDESGIGTFWMMCRWPSDAVLSDLVGVETEFHLIDATKSECLQRLQDDDMRPDKEAWSKIIEAWFEAHGGEVYTQKTSSFDVKQARNMLDLEKLRY